MLGNIKVNNFIGKTILCFDLETTGFPKCVKYESGKNVYFCPTDNTKYNNSRIVQIGWSTMNDFSIENIEKYQIKGYIRKPLDFKIDNTAESTQIHKITHEISQYGGQLLSNILNDKGFRNAILECDYVMGHNILFDIYILMNELHRMKYNVLYTKLKQILDNDKYICTLRLAQNLKKELNLGSLKLGKLYIFFYGEEQLGLHNAEIDVAITLKVFKKLFQYVSHNNIQVDLYNIVVKQQYNEKNKIYLNVPFMQKDKVKQMGAKYDAEKKKWYVIGSIIGFEKYLD
jgi:DNA polymerase III epsilon subunit-like protein